MLKLKLVSNLNTSFFKISLQVHYSLKTMNCFNFLINFRPVVRNSAAQVVSNPLNKNT